MSQLVIKKPGVNDELCVKREKGKVWSHIRKKWIVETPEETVRQEYLCVLVNEYGFSLDQIRGGRGYRPRFRPRALTS